MNNVLTPALGSNQHKTVFGAKKRKLKITTKQKLTASVLLLLALSLSANYYLLKTNYVINCNVMIGDIIQEQAGHFMNDRKCDQINNDWVQARNYDEEKMAAANPY